MKLSIFLIVGFLLLLMNIANAQIENMDKYYPANELYKNLKVKTVIDSPAIHNNPVWVKEYDNEGRLTHSYYKGRRPEGYKYILRGDTLFRFMYYYPGSNGLYSAEKFIYDNNKRITKYVLYRNDYSGHHKVFISMDEFLYNDQQQISCIMQLYSDDYPDSLRENMPVNKDLLELRDVIYYEHHIGNGKSLIIGKHALGRYDWRETDTLIYDTRKRLVKKSSYAKRGFIGEMGYNNLTQIEIFAWSAGKKIEENYYTYYDEYIPEYKIYLRYTESPHDIDEYIYDSNGLLKEKTSFYNNGERMPLDVYNYEFYD